MTQAQRKATVKATSNNVVKLDAVTAITTIANLMLTVARAPELIQVEVDALRKAKITMGTVKQKCALALRFKSIFDEATSPVTNKPITPSTRDNYMSEVRKAINTGSKFVFNTAQAKAMARAKVQGKKPAARAAEPTTPEVTTTTTKPTTTTTTTTAAPNAIKAPEQALKEIAKAICSVRAVCTQEAWAQILVLHPTMAKLLETWGDTWAPAPTTKPAPKKKAK